MCKCHKKTSWEVAESCFLYTECSTLATISGGFLSLLYQKSLCIERKKVINAEIIKLEPTFELIGKRERTGRVGETLIVLLGRPAGVCMPPFGRFEPVAPKWRKSSRRPSRRCTVFGTAALPNFTIFVVIWRLSTRDNYLMHFNRLLPRKLLENVLLGRPQKQRLLSFAIGGWKIIEMQANWSPAKHPWRDNLVQEHETGLCNS